MYNKWILFLCCCHSRLKLQWCRIHSLPATWLGVEPLAQFCNSQPSVSILLQFFTVLYVSHIRIVVCQLLFSCCCVSSGTVVVCKRRQTVVSLTPVDCLTADCVTSGLLLGLQLATQLHSCDEGVGSVAALKECLWWCDSCCNSLITHLLNTFFLTAQISHNFAQMFLILLGIVTKQFQYMN